MWIDLKKFKEDYDSYIFQQKIETVTIMIQSLIWKWDNFDNIYHFILQNPENVLENELDEVFWVLIFTLYKDSQLKIKQVDQKLENIKNKILRLKQEELKEKKQDDADVFLKEAFVMI